MEEKEKQCTKKRKIIRKEKSWHVNRSFNWNRIHALCMLSWDELWEFLHLNNQAIWDNGSMCSLMDRSYRQLRPYVPPLVEVEGWLILEKTKAHCQLNSYVCWKHGEYEPPGGNDEQPVMNWTTDFLSRPSSSNMTLRNFVKPGLEERNINRTHGSTRKHWPVASKTMTRLNVVQ